MQEHILTWQTFEPGANKKNSSWYWSVGILGAGIAIASFILGNILLGVLAAIAAAAVMLAGSRPAVRQTCIVSDKGIRIGGNFFPYSAVAAFAIKEDDPKRLILKTSGFMGTVSVSLEGVDFRAVRMELKNHNVEEVDQIYSFSEKMAEWMGM